MSIKSTPANMKPWNISESSHWLADVIQVKHPNNKTVLVTLGVHCENERIIPSYYRSKKPQA